MVMPLPTRQIQIDFNDFTPPSVKGVERGQCYVTQSVIILSAVDLSELELKTATTDFAANPSCFPINCHLVN